MRFFGWGAAALVLLGGAAFAQIPDGSGMINACFRSEGDPEGGGFGKLRVVDPGTPCQGKETALRWGGAGPQGPAGPEGPQGPAGDPGGLSGYSQEQSDFVQPSFEGEHVQAVARCAEGTKVVGGGYHAQGGMIVVDSQPWGGFGGWYVSAKDASAYPDPGAATGIIAHAICVNAM